MRWRGQGILTAVVLVAAAAYALQWHYVSRVIDATEQFGDALPIDAYTQPVAEFFDARQRWPSAAEVTLPVPTKSGVISAVTLGENGALHYQLAGWTLRGRMSFTLAPVVQADATLPARVRLSYQCVEVHPAQLQDRVCRSGLTSLADIAHEHADALVKWQADRSRLQQQQQRETLRATEKPPVFVAPDNQCAKIAARARAESIPCLARIDAKQAQRLESLLQTQFQNFPPLRDTAGAEEAQDYALRKNQACKDRWRNFAGQIGMSHLEAKPCFSQSDTPVQ